MKPHESWLLKAENDLKSAIKLIAGQDTICDTAIYHAQQCGEKSLKAYLVFRRLPIEQLRTHDMELLVEICCDFDSAFSSLTDEAILLNPYSTAFRYPDVMLTPELEDVQEAIEKADKIFHFVKNKLA